MKLTEEKLNTIVRNCVNRVLTEAANANRQKQIRDELAQKILGTNSFEEFYKNTGFWVSGRDYYLMSEYFKQLAEIEKQQSQNNGQTKN